MNKKKAALIRCKSCRTINSVPVERMAQSAKCGKCKSALVIPDIPVRVNIANWDTEVNDWPGVVLIDFYAQWCGACRIIAPVLAELAKSARGFIKIVTVDVDSSNDLGKEFKVTSTPTLVLYKGGHVINRIEGALDKDQMESWLAHSLAAH